MSYTHIKQTFARQGKKADCLQLTSQHIEVLKGRKEKCLVPTSCGDIQVKEGYWVVNYEPIEVDGKWKHYRFIWLNGVFQQHFLPM